MSTKGKDTTLPPGPNTSDPLKAALRDEMIINEINKNFAQNLVVTTEDKIRIFVYTNYPDRWTDPFWFLGVFLTFLMPLMTADFRSFPLIKADTLKHICFGCAIVSAGLLARSMFLAWKRPSHEDLVEQIKSGTLAGNAIKTNLFEDCDHHHEIANSSDQQESFDELM